MIRINLLPYREKAKKENVRRQVSILAGVLVLFVLVLFAVHLYFTMSVSRLEAEVKAADTKLVALNKKVGDVEGLKREKKELEQKLGVIKTLDGNRLFHVRMLDGVGRLVPERDMWLEKISESQDGRQLRIEGMARDSLTVAGFMKSLEKAGFILSVELVVSREKEAGGLKLQQFTVNCVIKREM